MEQLFKVSANAIANRSINILLSLGKQISQRLRLHTIPNSGVGQDKAIKNKIDR